MVSTPGTSQTFDNVVFSSNGAVESREAVIATGLQFIAIRGPSIVPYQEYWLANNRQVGARVPRVPRV